MLFGGVFSRSTNEPGMWFDDIGFYCSEVGQNYQRNEACISDDLQASLLRVLNLFYCSEYLVDYLWHYCVSECFE